jgi:iron(III) transport system permease protein
MSLVDATVAAALRALVVASIAVALAYWLLPRLRGMPAKLGWSVFAAGGLAYFTPTMLAGYGWLPTVTQWPAGSVARESFYAGALLIRLAPIGALALWLARPGPDPAAQHVWKLAHCRSWKFWWRETGAAPWLSGGLVFLLAFQEFDLATSWGIRSWTVSLFDAQIGGLATRDSLRLCLVPLTVELAVILPLLMLTRRARRQGLLEQERTAAPAPAVLVYAVAALTFFVVMPAVMVFRLGADGFRAWIESPSMLREVGHAFVSGGIAATLAWLIAGTRAAWLRALLAMPGLLGPLVLGLAVLGALQWGPAAADTVLPWLFALTLQLLPMALLLRLLLERGIDRASLHAARLAGARGVEWTLWKERAVAAGLLLFCLGYGDFTISTLLAPPQFSTIFPRVFNLMHYGQSAVLSFSVLVAVLAPLAIAAVALLLLRLYVRRRFH